MQTCWSRRLVAVLTACLLISLIVVAADAQARAAARVGDTFEVVFEQTTEETGDFQNGSSFTRQTLIERVVGVSDDGVELEFAQPGEANGRQWQFPVRVFKPRSGPLRMLNRPELEQRLDAWLAAAKLPKSACGRWIFTWTAYRIECDPESALRIAEQFDLRSADFTEGAPYTTDGALGPAPLKRSVDGSGTVTYTVELQIDAAAVLEARIRSDLAVAEMMGKPLTADQVRQVHECEAVTGRISLSFELDPEGGVRRRTRTTEIKTADRDGRSGAQTVVETMTRTRVR